MTSSFSIMGARVRKETEIKLLDKDLLKRADAMQKAISDRMERAAEIASAKDAVERGEKGAKIKLIELESKIKIDHNIERAAISEHEHAKRIYDLAMDDLRELELLWDKANDREQLEKDRERER